MVVGELLTVDNEQALGRIELGPFAFGERVTRGRLECRDEHRQRQSHIGVNGVLLGLDGQLAPALRLLEARSARAAEVRHIGEI